jgi:DNA-binding transcriptional regulator GbsR (MarR family)
LDALINHALARRRVLSNFFERRQKFCWIFIRQKKEKNKRDIYKTTSHLRKTPLSQHAGRQPKLRQETDSPFNTKKKQQQTWVTETKHHRKQAVTLEALIDLCI